MDLYTAAVEQLEGLPVLKIWPEPLDLLKRAASKKPRHWRLPILACAAVGGSRDLAMPLVTAIACLHKSIILIDDILDDDPRGEYHRIGEGAAANLAAALQAAGIEVICQCQSDPVTKLAAIRSLNQMMLKTASGQHMDIKNPQDEDAYWGLVRTKSSPFFGAALHIGALFGGADPKIAVQIEKFGHLYGEMIQIHDDLNDTMETLANPDWTQGRAPLPILFAQIVDHPERARFIALKKDIFAPNALAKAQTILIRCGAISYCIDQLLRRVQVAREILTITPLARPEKLAGLLADVVEPVKNLFTEIGLEHPETLLQPSELVS